MNDELIIEKQFNAVYNIGITTARIMGLIEQDVEECAFGFLEKVILNGTIEGCCFPDDMHFNAWVRHSVRNYIIDYLRFKNYNHEHELLQSEMKKKNTETIYDISTISIGPEEDILNREFREEICNCLAILAPLSCEIFVRHYIDEISLDELASDFGRTANAVGQILFRTRKRLKLIMQMKGIIIIK